MLLVCMYIHTGETYSITEDNYRATSRSEKKDEGMNPLLPPFLPMDVPPQPQIVHHRERKREKDKLKEIKSKGD